MKVEERPVVFECEGVQLIGILHIPEQPQAAGVLGVTAGGLQYRAGCGRQLLSLARSMASQGTPVMRFDRRGIGDSVGELLGFEHMEADLRSAIAIFQENVPELKHIVLYGGCEAASGIMISAYQLSGANSVILANPWVSDSMHAVVSSRHYYNKLRDPRFWKKLITGQYNLAEYASSFSLYLKNKLFDLTPGHDSSSHAIAKNEIPFQERMLSGFQKFDGPVLFLKSGLSLISEEFDYLVSNSKVWQKAYGRASVKRRELPSADQTFSTAAARGEINAAVTDWIIEMNKISH
jgi:uncharacterized protein